MSYNTNHRPSNSVSSETPRHGLHRNMSPLASGPSTPIDTNMAYRSKPPKPSKSKVLQHRDPSISSVDGDFTPDRGYPNPFEQPHSRQQSTPTLSISHSDGSSTIAASDTSDRPPLGLIPTPQQPYPRQTSDGSVNHRHLDSSSQSGCDTPTENTGSVSQHSSSGIRQAPNGIIYRLALNDYKEGPINGTTFRYSFKPFEGLNRSDNPERHKMAVMDLSSNVLGYWPRGSTRRNNQLRDSFWKDEDRAPFVVGVDFISRSHTYFSIRIHSKQVLDCLRQEIKYYPDLGLALEQPEVSFEYPYKALIHYYDNLQNIRSQCPISYDGVPESSTLYNYTTRQHLDVVLGHLETIYMNDIQPDLDMHKLEIPVAKFDSLWLLFKPGETVFARIKGQLMFFKVLSANRDIDKAGDPTGPWSVIVWGLYFDGYLLRRQPRKFKIHEYHGLRDIQKLPIKPISFLEASPEKLNERLQSLSKRGRQYYDFICDAPRYRRYNGPVNGDEGEPYIGDVIVDPTSYIKEHTKSKALPGEFEVMFGARDEVDLGEVMMGDPPDYGGGPYTKLNDRVCSKSNPLEIDDEYLLLPGYIQGYALRGKKWVAFDVSSFISEKMEERPWDSLVIDDPHDVQLLQSLAHTKKDKQGTELSPWTGDFIAGKGQGQVVLLHGPSGVGKTMTVECIATQMERPLLCLTVADIGTKETEAELNLSKWLALATKWGAIVLIDEAETFLTERGEGDLAKNAIVTAFLRTLEYHQGLIFLTTNDPGHIDDAVISRVHLAIEYRTLNQKQRQKIWRNLINQMDREQKSLPENVPRVTIPYATMMYVTNEGGIKDVDKLEVSGRDIRNAFQAAVRLARYEAGLDQTRGGASRPVEIELQDSHFDRAFQNKLALKRNINSISGQSITKRDFEKGKRRETKPE